MLLPKIYLKRTDRHSSILVAGKLSLRPRLLAKQNKQSKKNELNQLGEIGLISRLQSHLRTRSPETLVGIGDDCALFKPKTGTALAASCDSLLVGIHFDLSLASFKDIGRKALSVNLSDIAAMGGVPKWALISLAVPKKIGIQSLDQLYHGLNQVCGEWQVDLAGGDTARSPRGLGIHITVLGEIKNNQWFTRKGAKPGDKVFVTGTLGDSALGLKILKSKKAWGGSKKDLGCLIEKHLNPTPRLEESKLLSGMFRHMGAMIDISDGLLQDLHHLCSASGVGAELMENALPKSQPFENIIFKNKCAPSELILSGGEDYELLFTFRPQNVKKLTSQFQKAGKRLTSIGTITGQPGQIRLINPGGQGRIINNPKGFNHFCA